MLPEFIAGTAISIILLVLLLWLLIKRLAVNRNKANRVAAFYLLPVVITLVLIGVFVFLVFPRVMDVPYVLAAVSYTHLDVYKRQLLGQAVVLTNEVA